MWPKAPPWKQARPWPKWNKTQQIYPEGEADLRAEPYASGAPAFSRANMLLSGLERSDSYFVPVFFRICSA